MKTLIYSFIMAVICSVSLSAAASRVLELKITGGGTNLPASVKRAMENNAVNLLTMLSETQERGAKTPDFRGIPISNDAKNTILKMWKFQPLKIWLDEGVNQASVHENLLNLSTVKGYQIRNIPVRLFPRDSPGKDKYSEVSIVFSPNGTIVDFNISIEKHQYDKLLKNSYTVQDKENRMMLAYWMDQLKMAYESKNTPYLESLFDDDAIIITGVRTSKRVPSDVKFKNLETFDYYVKNKKQYLSKLKKVFKYNNEIVVNFLDQKYQSNDTYITTDSKGDTIPRYYMVWCTQEWLATNYPDVGKLFILWDFKNPEKPTILVRAWTHPDDPKQFNDDDFILTNR